MLTVFKISSSEIIRFSRSPPNTGTHEAFEIAQRPPVGQHGVGRRVLFYLQKANVLLGRLIL